MKFHRTMILIPLVCLGLCSLPDRAYAVESVSDDNISYESISEDSISVSEDDIPEEEIPGEKLPEEDIPGGEKPEEEKPKEENPKEENPKEENPKEENPKEEKPKEEKPKEEKSGEEKPKEEICKIEIKTDKVIYDDGAAVIKILVESTGSEIKRAEVCNAKAGVRKILFESGREAGDRALVLHFRTRANGKYIFRACDTKGNTDSCEVFADGIERRSFSDYREKAKENRSGSPSVYRRDGASGSTGIYGGPSRVQETIPISGREYTVSSGGDKKDDKEPDTGKYEQWSLLNEKEKTGDERIWYEPNTVKTENEILGNETDDMPDLSDYGVKLFRTAVISPPDSPSNITDDSSTGADISVTKIRRDDVRGSDDPVVWITVVISIVMILAVVLIIYMIAGRSKK